jgi:sugar lactone lactonase YvrE
MTTGKAGTLSAARQLVRKQLRVPENYPVVTEMRTDAAGNIWLRRAPNGQHVEWLVYDAAGRKIGSVRVPLNVRIQHVGLNSLLGVQTGEFDEPYVVQLQVVRSR